MKTTLKFLIGAFALALSTGFYAGVQAQSNTSVEKRPGPTIEVFIKVNQRSLKIFDLKAIVRNRIQAEGQAPFTYIWMKNREVLGYSQDLKHVSFGTYTVYVIDSSKRYGEASVTLSPQVVMMGKVSEW